MAKTAKSITLVWYAKTGRGWRYFPAILEKRLGATEAKHGWVMDGGQLVEYSTGRYALRTFVNGKPVYETLDTCNPYKAVTRLRNAQRAAQQAGAVRSVLSVIESARAAYIKDCEHRGAHEAAEQARVTLAEFIPLTDPAVYVRDITRAHVFAFHKALAKRGCEPRTIENKHNRVRSWLKFCKADTGFLPPAPKRENKLPTIYSPEEIKALRGAAGDTMRLVIDMGLKLGLREQEIAHAEWGDVTGSVFRVQGKPRYGFAVKDAEQRDIPIPADLLQVLTDRRDGAAPGKLIVSNRAGQPDGHLLRKLQSVAKQVRLHRGRCRRMVRSES